MTWTVPELEPSALPYNPDAEQSIIGCALFNNGAVHLSDGLRPDHFHNPLLGDIWRVILEKVNRNALAECIGVHEALITDPRLQDIGGLRYLADLMTESPFGQAAPEFARIIMDLALKRELIRVSEKMAYAARIEPSDGLDQLAKAERELSELAHHGGAPSQWSAAGAVVSSALSIAKNQTGLVGLSTGLADLDDAIGGLRSGQMIIVAGRPAMGKSTGALQIAKGVARRGRGVIFYSMEMPHFDLGLRMACDVAHNPVAPQHMGKSTNPTYFNAARGKLDKEAWWKLDEAREEIERWPLLFDDRPGLTVATMMSGARRQFREWERRKIEPGCIIVDHLTIVKAEQDRKGNKVAEVGDISRALAEMAKTLGVPVVALCQLSRDVEKRQGNDRRPGLSDLRWSGEIEQDARVVTFLYRPEYYLKAPENPEDFEANAAYEEKLDKVKNKLFWLVEKNNNGPTGQVETYCDIACSAIRDKLGSRT